MKKFASIAAATVLAGLATPALATNASAAGPTPPWQIPDSAQGVQWTIHDFYDHGGWCDNGQPNSAWAIRSTDGKTHKLTIEDYYNDGKRFTSAVRTITVTPAGSVYAGLGRGSRPAETIKLWPGVNGLGPSLMNPESCAGLQNHLPANPWGSVTPTPKPTKTTPAPKPTKTTPAPKPTKTTPAPKPTKTTTAPKPSTTKPTPKPTKPGGTHTVPAPSKPTHTAPVPAHTSTATAPAPVTSTSMPTAPAAHTTAPAKPGTGPKVDTDQVGSNNNATELSLAAGIGALALVGGGTVVARRRR